jgi:hypothetical protein
MLMTLQTKEAHPGNGGGNGKGMAARMPMAEPLSGGERARALPQLVGMQVGLEIHIRMAEASVMSEPPKESANEYCDWLRNRRAYLEFLAADLPAMLVLLETEHSATAVKGLSVLAVHGSEEQVRLAARLQLERAGVQVPKDGARPEEAERPIQGTPQVIQNSARELRAAIDSLERALEAREGAAYPLSVIVAEAVNLALDGIRQRFQDIVIQVASDPGDETARKALELLSRTSVSLKDKVAADSLRRLVVMAGKGLNPPGQEASSASLSAQGS